MSRPFRFRNYFLATRIPWLHFADKTDRPLQRHTRRKRPFKADNETCLYTTYVEAMTPLSVNPTASRSVASGNTIRLHRRRLRRHRRRLRRRSRVVSFEIRSLSAGANRFRSSLFHNDALNETMKKTHLFVCSTVVWENNIYIGLWNIMYAMLWNISQVKR